MSRISTVALVGPPNVGKSTLFNTILGKRIAVTGPHPGTTRDRSYSETAWSGKKFILVDTGGLARTGKDALEQSIREQTKLAVLEANLIIFIVDARMPIAASLDAAKELKKVLRENKLQGNVPVLLVANKAERRRDLDEVESKFIRLGLGRPFAVSALTGAGVGDLLDAAGSQLEQFESEPDKEIFTSVAIVGRPNVGKSTLVNHLLGEERVIVSPVPGTTRAAVDVDIEYKEKIIRFIDTAGMRRRAKIELDVEEYSLFQAVKSIENSDVVVLLLDASSSIARFEQTIAGKLKESIKGIVIGLNKIDTLPEGTDLETFTNYSQRYFPFLRFTRVIPISAINGQNVDRLLDAIIEAKLSRENRIEENALSQSLKKWMKKTPPKKLQGQKKPIVYDLKQVRTNPPSFHLIVNDPAAIHYSYLRFLENQIRKAYGFAGTAIKIRARTPER